MFRTKTRVLLLVEDNPADAALVCEYLAADDSRYSILTADTIASARQYLFESDIDVALLDLGLPDAQGIDTLRALRTEGRELPIVVLTGSDDESLALQCIEAGAEDYLVKDELRPHTLRRAIGYAMNRLRERQLRETQQLLAHFRSLSSEAQPTSVTATLAGLGAVALRHPEEHERLVDFYFDMLRPCLERRDTDLLPDRAEMDRIITRLGDAGGGPRDLLDIHVAALDRALERRSDAVSRGLVLEARLLALRMMGLLVDYYRVGHRRRFVEGSAR